MSIKQLRLDKGWSQEHLAQISGLSNRTIQRIERGQRASLDSLNCLAAIFEKNVTTLMQEQTMNELPTPKSTMTMQDREEAEAIEYVKNLKAFHVHWMVFVIVIPALFIFNSTITPDYMWVYWVIGGWGLGLALNAMTVFGMFNLFGPDWEHKKFNQRMNRR